MIVVADTTPLNYLVLIDEIDLLQALYELVLIPDEVLREMQRPKTPAAVQAWVSNLPAWCEVRSPASIPDAALSALDAGERDAIQLALDSGIDMVLMDEREGREEAKRRHLKVTGTISLLEKAAQLGLVDFRAALQRLEQTNFRLSASLREAFLGRNL